MENSVELRGICKSFGPVAANVDVHFSVRGGSVHAIVGENGAGKSTAMKILYGQYRADAGEILIGGKACHWHSPADAIAAGIGMVHQHFMLSGRHTAVENVLLASQRSSFIPLATAATAQKLSALMREYHMEVDLHRPVEELPVGMQQRIEILKLLYSDAKILILDEPTAVLAPGEIQALFRTLRGMAARGKTVLVITHKLKEVLEGTDRVTVFRAGRVVAEQDTKETQLDSLAALMIGRELKSRQAERRPPNEALTLELREVVPRNERLDKLSFRLHEGEILGVAGVEGNGQSELIRLLLHPRAERRSGSIQLLGQDVGNFDSAKMRAASFGLFPEDRREEGLLLDSTSEDNFLLGKQWRSEFLSGKCFLSRRKLRVRVNKSLKEYDVRPPSATAIAGGLSGGNQQKLLVARELLDSPRFVLAAQPTRGVDIGACEFIHEKLLELRNRGTGILLISSELDEVLKLADRLLVLYRGKVVGSFARGEYSEEKIGCLMAGGEVA